MPLTPGTLAAEIVSHSGPAVEADDAHLSYTELTAAATKAAARLAAAGVGPGSVVALCLPRSAALVVAELAVLLCGAAYLPLDPAHPPLRRRALLQDSGAAALLGTPDTIAPVDTLAAARPTDRGAPVDTVDTLAAAWPTDRGAPVDLPGVGLLARLPGVRRVGPDVACVLYTSGSTGTPKGVPVPHAGLTGLARWHRETFRVGPGTRCSQLAGPGFDAAGWEIWGALAAGATLVVAPEEARTDPLRLKDWLVEQAIEVAFLPTPLAEAALALAWPLTIPLRCVLTGGDRLHHAPRIGLPFTLVNNYGVTEASVVTTSGVVPAGGTGTPTIGRPIAGVATLVVDATLAPADAGELLVAGGCLASGYLDRPELTAERFVELADADGRLRRWYRTGDQVRRLPGGELSFAGRDDDQVQLLGVRVELGEVEAVLTRHPGVGACVVLPSGEGGAAGLVAHLEGAPLELRDWAADRLPAAMVPGQFRWHERLPVNVNGKLDRRALAEAPPEAAVAEGEGLAASIAVIIAGLLGRERVGVEENFLLLGGHSLLGAQLLIRLGERFGVELGLRAVFAHPTATGMAGEVHRLLVEEVAALSDEEAVAATRGGSGGGAA